MLRVVQVAERLNCSVSTVYALIERGNLPHYRIGGAIRVGEEECTVSA
ncbi:MAG: helix-turn-helix domain-containing protein [Pirellulales bacterium]|nr:helix-turn-helix domain-containing protein [Pirellulales bacterium]